MNKTDILVSVRKRAQTGNLAIRLIYNVARCFGFIDRSTAAKYFKAHSLRKLHIGCGDNILKGWLNTDFYPLASGIIHLDATKKLNFSASSFDYIFSEHMIEHIPQIKATSMLQECYRILKPGGKLRLVTPDLYFVCKLIMDRDHHDCERYIQWAIANSDDNVSKSAPCVVANRLMRDWGHLFLYDHETLTEILQSIGFTQISKHKVHISSDQNLAGLENCGRMPKGLLEIESLVLDAVKPLS